MSPVVVCYVVCVERWPRLSCLFAAAILLICLSSVLSCSHCSGSAFDLQKLVKEEVKATGKEKSEVVQVTINEDDQEVVVIRDQGNEDSEGSVVRNVGLACFVCWLVHGAVLHLCCLLLLHTRKNPLNSILHANVVLCWSVLCLTVHRLQTLTGKPLR